jgi:hypothetical protein
MLDRRKFNRVLLRHNASRARCPYERHGTPEKQLIRPNNRGLIFYKIHPLQLIVLVTTRERSILLASSVLVLFYFWRCSSRLSNMHLNHWLLPSLALKCRWDPPRALIQSRSHVPRN